MYQVKLLKTTFLILLATVIANAQIKLEKVGGISTGGFNSGAAEISAYDSRSKRIFVINAMNSSVDIIDISDPAKPTTISSIMISPFGRQPNSVDANNGVIAVAIENVVKTSSGTVVFFNSNGQFLSSVQVGALPDMLTFTNDGRKVLVANEGEPNDDYTIDPEGSVSIIDLSKGAINVKQSDVRTATFSAFNSSQLDPSIRVFGPRANVAQDLEPEYIAVSRDSKTAYVTLQENNAVAVIDIDNAKVTKLIGLGFKDHSKTGNRIDASDRDRRVNIATWPVKGIYQPDSIAFVRRNGENFFITANEGDARDYRAFSEEARVKDLMLDPTAFPNSDELKKDENLGRLTVTKATGDRDNDGDYEELYAFGARSFSIWSEDGNMIFDSGEDFERISAEAFPAEFNSDQAANGSFDTRSDNKGPEPEALAVGECFGRVYTFIGLERIGGIMVYDITKPRQPKFVQYINTRLFTGDPRMNTAGDLGPEGIEFVSRKESPTKDPLLIVSNEISGTVTIYKITRTE